VKVSIPSQEFPDIMRRAIRFHSGKPGFATREECRAWFVEYGGSADDDVIAELIEAEPQWGANP